MWSGPSVTGERPESVELTTLLTIKRQPDTASSSSPLLSKASIANPCSPEEGHSRANQPMSQAGYHPVSDTQESNQCTNLLHTLPPTSLKLLSVSLCLFLLSLGISSSHLFRPIFLPYIFTFLSSASSLNVLQSLFLPIFFSSALQLSGWGCMVITTQG